MLLTGNPVYEFEGHRYVAVEQGTIAEVRSAAEAIGGEIVSVNSQAEQDFITQTFQASGETFFIGLSDRANEGQFAWFDGSELTYTNWATGEPNNWSGNQYHGYSDGEDFVMMYGDGTWNDVSELACMRAIVEISDHDGCTDLIVNGSFEEGPVRYGSRFYQEADIPGWQLDSTSSSRRKAPRIQLLKYSGFASDGDTALELDSLRQIYDVVYQDISTTAGETYALSFDLRKRTHRYHHSDDVDNEVEVWWDGELLDVFSPDSRHSWNRVNVEVTAGNSGQTRLEFRERPSGSYGGGDGFGPLIDNVKLCAAGIVANTAPELSSIEDLTMDEGTQLQVQLSATDADAGQQLTYEIVGGPSDATIDANTGLILWTPTEADGPGQFDFSVRVRDNGQPSLTDTASFSVQVAEVNSAPILNLIDDATAEPDQELTITVSALDPDLPVQTLSYSILSGPNEATIDASTGELNWTPGHTTVGDVVFEIGVSDGQATDSQSFTVTVEPCVNLITNGSFEEGQLRHGNRFYREDQIPGWQLGGEDVYGNGPLKFQVFANHSNGASDGNAFLELDTLKRFYDVIYQDVPVVEGESYELSFDLRARTRYHWHHQDHHEHHQESNEVEVWWEGQQVGVFSPESNQSWTASTVTVQASQTGQARLEFRERRTGHYGGNDGLGPLLDNVKLCGNSNDSNVAPTLASIPDQTIDELSAWSLQLSASDANAGQSLTFSLTDAPAGATIDASTGLIQWTPSEQDGPADVEFSVSVSDGELTDEASFTVTVAEVNAAPVLASIEDQVVNEGEVFTITPSATDADLPANSLVYSLAAAPAGATIDTATGEVNWTPSETDGPGSFEFTISVSDGELTDEESFTVTVAEVNAAPVLASIEDQNVNEGEAFTITPSATDADLPANSLVYSLAAAPAGATIDTATGEVNWTPSETDGPGTFEFTIAVTDGELTAQVSFTVTVAEVNAAPVLASIDDQTIEQTLELSFMAVATDVDVPAGDLTFSLAPGAAAGATLDPTTGEFSWIPALTLEPGDYAFTVIVDDANGGVASQSFTVTVVPSSDKLFLAEQDRFETTAVREIVVGPDVQTYRFRFEANFDESNDSINDAFEVAIVDEDGTSLVHTFAQNRDAYFNLTEGQSETASVNVALEGDTVKLDLSHLANGTVATIVFRLVNTDGDSATTVLVTDIETTSEALGTPAGVAMGTDSPSGFAPIDLNELTDVTGSFSAEFGHTSFNAQDDALFTNVALTNVGQVPIAGRLIAVISGASQEQIQLIEPDGRLPDGRFYVDITPESRQIAPGESARTHDFVLSNPENQQFEFELTLLAELNHAPIGFVSEPPTVVEAGNTLSYTAQAIDPDAGQTLTYSIVAGPEGATIHPGTGEFVWDTTVDHVGNQTVTIRASDPLGQFIEQRFTVEVVDALQNRPPVFTTSPVTDAVASSGFEVTTLATGDTPIGVSVVGGLQEPRIVTANGGDQTLGIYARQNDDRFDDATSVNTGFPVRGDEIFDVGYAIDIGIPDQVSTSFDSSLWGFVQADINNDGNLDFVNGISYQDNYFSTRNEFSQIAVNLGDGSGGFAEATLIFENDNESSAGDFRSLDIADLNSDGNVDLVFADRAGDGRLFAMLGDGEGGFSDAHVQSFTDANDEAIAINDFLVADIDGDGNEDLIGQTGGLIYTGRVYIASFDPFFVAGNGDGTFGDTLTSFGSNATYGPSVLHTASEPYDVGDLDGDGDLDFATHSGTKPNLDIFLNDGSGNFVLETTITVPTRPIGAAALQIADFTGDGNLDILHSVKGRSEVRLLVGDGSGVDYVDQVAIEAAAYVDNLSGTGRPADIDGDGDLDLIIGSSTVQSYRPRPFVAINDGNGVFTLVHYAMPHFGGGASGDFARFGNFGDYNNDGVIDFSVGIDSNDRAGVGVRLGTRAGNFGGTRTFPDLSDRYLTGNGDRANGVAIGDFDGDGNMDHINVSLRQTRLGNGDGTFGDPILAFNVSRVGSSTNAVGDFNNDGLDDFVATSGTRGGSNSLYFVALSNGDGTFRTELTGGSSGDSYGYQKFLTADFNRDGFQDFIAKGSISRHIDVWLNDPETPGVNFTRSFRVDLDDYSQGVNANNWQESLAIDDFTGDGIIDIATPTRSSEDNLTRLQIWSGDGTGEFSVHSDEKLFDDVNQSEQLGVSNFFYNPGDLVSGDIDNDGDSDLISSTTSGPRVFINDGTGNFEFSNQLNDYGTQGRGFDTFLIDLSNDGNLDLVLTGGGQGPLTVLPGNGDGTFAAPVQSSVVGQFSSLDPSGFADFDGDGHLELIYSTAGGGSYVEMLSTAIYAARRDGIVDQLAFDLDGDGNEEMLIVNERMERLQIFHGDSSGELNRQFDLHTGLAPQAVTVADLNGDGVVEILVANRASESITIYSGDLDNGFTSTEVGAGGALIDIATADVNGDGNSDVFALDVERNGVLSFISDGTTTLTAPVEIAVGEKPGRLVIADANGDGTLDALVTLTETNRVMILDDIGSGNASASLFVDMESAPGDLAVVDLNDDGNPDLVVTLPESDQVSIHYGRGNNQFALAQNIDVGQRPERLTIADMDQDGRLDIVVANSGDNTASVIYNRYDPSEVYHYDSDATDPDNDTVVYRLVDGPGGMFINRQTGQVTWAAAPNQVGTHSVTIEASDGNGGVGTQTYQISVEAARENHSPLIATEPVAKIGAGESFAYQAHAVDADNDALRYRLLSGPDGASIDPVSGLVSWDGRFDGAALIAPNGNAASSGEIHVPISDSLASASATIEGWFNFQEHTANNGAARPFQLLDDSRNQVTLSIFANSRLDLTLFNGTTSETVSLPFDLNIDQWYHFATVIDDVNQTYDVLVDGESVMSGDLPASQIFDNINVTVGLANFSGRVDNFRIWNVARTPEQIRSGLARQFDGDPKLVVDLRFEDEGARNVRDHSAYRNDGYRVLNYTSIAPEIVENGLAEAGVHSFVIGVEDGRGGTTTQAFDVEIVPELRGAIEGNIFNDTNGDGIRNDGADPDAPAENSLENWSVFIDANNNRFADPGEHQSITDSEGNYRFDELLPDTYAVRVAPAAGFEAEALRDITVVVNQTTTMDVAAVQSPLSQIQGRLVTADGDAIGNWATFIDLNDDGTRDTDEPMATSDRLGNFAVTGLPAGDYVLRADLPAGWMAADGLDGVEVTLAADAVSLGHDLVVEPTNTSVAGGVHFVTTAPTTVQARGVYRYASVAANIFGHEIAYDLSLAPTGLTIDPNTGQVAWQPTVGQVGQQQVILRATDASGSISLQSFTVDVSAPNSAPVITSTPPGNGYVGAMFVYDLRAQDSDQDALTYSLATAPDTASINTNGRVEWQADAAGSFEVEVVVTDSAGNSVFQNFTVEVLSEAPDATPFATALPRADVGLGQTYRSQITGTDGLGRSVDWSLVSGPTGFEVARDGILSWTPDAIGTQTIELLATTVDGDTEQVTFDLIVVGRPVIVTPEIVSEPALSAMLNTEYAYDVQLGNGAGMMVSFSVLNGPVGASIDPDRGTLRWTPQVDQLGDVDFEIEVVSTDGESSTQRFNVSVSRVGGPPLITSIPPTEANVGGAYLYSIEAADREGDPLSYRLLAAPAGLTIVESTGEISWTPASDQVGEQTVAIEVADGFGNASTQAFSVLVGDGIVNLVPVISSEAPRFAVVGTLYSYQLDTTDPENTNLTYEVSRGPTGLVVSDTGLVTWTPTADQSGKFVVTLRVTDAGGATAIESYELDVLAENSAPEIISTAPTSSIRGIPFRYDVLVNDANFDPLGFELVHGPTGASVNAFGQIVWAPSDPTLGTYDFEIRVHDPRGGEATQAFTLDLVADTEGPRVSLAENLSDGSRNILPWQGPFVVYARAIDNVAVASLTLSANGQDIPLSANGTAVFTFEDWRFETITATATAVDTSGNVSTETITFDYDVPEGWSEDPGPEVPTAIITSPTDDGTASGLVSIVGTADHEDFGAYVLSYRLADELTFTEIARSTTAVVDGELGVWDTSLLRNDEYVIRLQVATAEGTGNLVEHNVGLTGDLKLGNFQLQFTDMVIPVAGIPIEIARVYDTLQADVEGDFGYGWRLAYRDTDLRVGLPKSGLENLGIYSGFRPGTKVYLTIPGEGRIGFTFNPELQVLPGFGGENLVVARPRFSANPGVTATMSAGVNGYIRVNDYGELVAPGNIPYHPASPDFGGAFVVTTAEGVTYRIDGSTGKLESATDANGTKITFSDRGIESSLGFAVTFETDSQDRITAIQDAEGNRIEYAYGSNGSLARVTDAEGNETKFRYDDANLTYLTEVIDPLGISGIRGEYDDEGRLISVTDAEGNRLGIETLVSQRQQALSDAEGNTTIQRFDELGNVVHETNALGYETSNTFDSQSNLTSTVDELGRTTSYTYDAFGNLLTQTQPDGGVIRYTYVDAQRGRIATVTDAAGNTRHFEYDSNGNITRTIDSQGNQSATQYDSAGRILKNRSITGAVTTFGYNENGLLASTDSDDGRSESYVYDAVGRLIEQKTTRLINGALQELTEIYTYDNNGNLTRTVNALGDADTFEYDANQQLIASTDALGRVTKFLYDSRGNQIATILPDATPDDDTDNARTSAQFDALGQMVQVTDERGNSTQFVYDAAGQLTEQIFADNTPENSEDNPRIQFEYDAGGQQITTINEIGSRTEYVYDSLGNAIEVKDALGNVSRNTFDSNGRITRSIDSLGNGTEFRYDNEGRLNETVYGNGTSDLVQYDLNGRPVVRTDRLGNETQLGYDSRGRVTSSANAMGGEIAYTYDDIGNILTQRDANGNTTSYRYDEFGRRTSSTLPGGESNQFEYDAVGNLIRFTDYGGNTQTFEYDARNRLTKQTVPGDGERTFEYFENGLLKSETNVEGTTSYLYDARDRLVSRTQPDENHVFYRYDDAGNTIEVTGIAGATKYEFDALSQVNAVTDADGNRTEYDYDDANRLIETRFANGLIERREYTSESFLKRVVTLDGTETVLDFSYEHDGSGQRTVVVDGDGNRTEYEYDQANRLINEKRFTAGQTAPTGEESFVYDLAGNRLQSISSTDGTTNYQYDSNDRLRSVVSNSSTTTFDYDANGNRISKTVHGQTTQYVFSSNNLLMGVHLDNDGSIDVGYTYDASGDLTSRTEDGSTIFFQTDESGQLSNILVEYLADGTIVTAYTHGLGILSQTRSDETYVYHTDSLGSVRALSDSNKTLVNRYDYANFGELSEDSATVENRYLFDGQRRDESTGLDYLRARFYDSQQGVMISVDPFEGTPLRSDSIHDYVYAGNNPINASDPSGRFTLSELSTVQISLGPIQKAFASSAQNGLKRAAGIADTLIAPGTQMQNLGIRIGFSNRPDRDRGYEIYLAGLHYQAAGWQALRIAIGGIYSDTLLKVVQGVGANLIKSQLPTDIQSFLKSFDQAKKSLIAAGFQKELNSIKNGLSGGKKKPSAIDALINQYVSASQQSLSIQGLARYANGLQTDHQDHVNTAMGIGDRLSNALDVVLFD